MAKTKLYEKINKKHIDIALGIIVILICIYGVINYTVVSNLMTYALVFLFGNLYIFTYLFFMFLGVCLILKGKLKKFKFNFISCGIIFLIIAVIMMLTLLNDNFKEMKFSNFDISSFISYDAFSKNGITFNINYGSGFIGIFIVTIFNSIFQTHYVTWIFCGLIFLASFGFLFYYPIKRLILFFKNIDKDSKFKAAKNIDLEETYIEENNSNINKIEQQKQNYINQKEVEPSLESSDIEETIVSKPTANYNSYFEEENFGIGRPKFNPNLLNNEEEIHTTSEEIHEEKNEPMYIKESAKDEKSDQLLGDEVQIEEEIDPMFSVDYEENISQTEIVESNFENEYVENDIEVVESLNEDVSLIKENQIIEENKPEIMIKPEVKEEPAPKVKPIKYFVPVDNFLEDHNDTEETILKNKEINDTRLEIINKTFSDFKIGAKAISYTIGPSVTRFDIATNADVSITSVEKYTNDIAINLGGLGIRFERIVPGKTTSAIEVPNEKASIVSYKDFYYKMGEPKQNIDLNVPFGINISGEPVYANLANFPHMLISGSSGSGKSVYVHNIIMTLILRNNFQNLKLLLIDPKDVEFSKYNGIPHLLSPNIAEPQKAKLALDKLCDEMDYRYAQLKETGASKLEEYNEDAENMGLPKLPYIVCILDEFADLVMVNKDIMNPVARLAQKARAAGIHVILCTQRPSADIVSGILKSNITVRAALMASAAIDSRIMFDQNGAEELIGNGDMLVSCSLISKNSLVRVQSPFLSRLEIRGVVNYLKETYGTYYDDNYTNLTILDEATQEFDDEGASDPLYPEVKDLAYGRDFISISHVCNTFKVGYNRAKRLYTQLQKDGIVDSSKEFDSNNKGKKVLVHSDEELEDINNGTEGLI